MIIDYKYERLKYGEPDISSDKAYIFPDPTGRFKIQPTDGEFVPNVYKTTSMSVGRKWSEPSESTLTAYSSNSYWEHITTFSGPMSTIGFHQTDWFDPDKHPDTKAAMDVAVLKAFGKVGASDLDLGVELGELKETIQMLKSPLKSLRRDLLNPSTLRALPNILKKEAGRKMLSKRFLRTFPDSWLEIRYGLMPLFRSISDILEVLEKGLTDLKLDRIYTARSNTEIQTKEYAGGLPVYIGPYNFPVSIEVERSHKVRGFVHYRFNKLPTVWDLLGLGPTYLPKVGYDLLSLTFVLDWFITLGDLVNYYRYKPDVTILGNCASVKTMSTGKIKMEPCSRFNFAGSDISDSNYGEELYHRYKGRTVPTTPMIQPSINLDWDQIVDLILLIGQRLPKRSL